MEKRKNTRIPASVLIDVAEANYAITRGRGYLANISTGGMGLDTALNFSIGTSLVLKIGASLELCGEVVRSEKKEGAFHYGVRFSNLGFFDKLKLKKYISTNFKK